jgi:hypothetical protein
MGAPHSRGAQRAAASGAHELEPGPSCSAGLDAAAPAPLSRRAQLRAAAAAAAGALLSRSGAAAAAEERPGGPGAAGGSGGEEEGGSGGSRPGSGRPTSDRFSTSDIQPAAPQPPAEVTADLSVQAYVQVRRARTVLWRRLAHSASGRLAAGLRAVAASP